MRAFLYALYALLLLVSFTHAEETSTPTNISCLPSERPRVNVLPTAELLVPVDKVENLIEDVGHIPSMEEWREQILSIVSALTTSAEENSTSNDSLMNNTESNIEIKTSKEESIDKIDQKLRFNYASAECGSKVLSSNAEATEVGSILFDAKDRYMLNPCTVNQWIIIELCEDIGIDSIAIANYEFFSSMFKDFTVYGSNKYPTNDWDELQSFTAKNIRELQYFKFNEPEHFKYIKLVISSHYGSEFYCPISVIKVHGSTLVEELKLQLEKDSQELDRFTNAMKSTTVSPILPTVTTTTNSPSTIVDLSNALPDSEQDIDISSINNLYTSPIGGDIGLQDVNQDASWNDVVTMTTNIVQDMEYFVSSSLSPSSHHPTSISSSVEDISNTAQESTSTSTSSSTTNQEPNNNNGEQTVTSKQTRHQQEENIFKTLANRIKSLEMNQSIVSKYLEEMNSRYSSFLIDLKSTLAKLEVEHIKFSKIIYAVENQRIVTQSNLESQLEQFDKRIDNIEDSIAMELYKLREQLLKQETDQRYELFGIVVLTIITIYIVLYFERLRYQHNYSQHNNIHYLHKQTDNQNISHNNTTPSSSDIHSQLINVNSKKSKRHQIKKAKSFANFKKQPLEAPL